MLSDAVQPIWAFALVLGPLIVLHELGHFCVARWCGVRVLRFSIGFGKPIWSRRFGKSETEWVISMIPLGGYVKMYDAKLIAPIEGQEIDLKGDFSSANVWKRIAIILAGPASNFLVAILLLAGILMHGTQQPLAKLRIGSTQSLAYQVGLRSGDKVLEINGEVVSAWDDMLAHLLQAGLNHQDANVKISRANPDRLGSTSVIEIPLHLSQMPVQELGANFLSAWGIDYFRPPAKIINVVAGGVASRAGLLAGDQIVEIDGRAIKDSLELIEIVGASANKNMQFQVRRGDQMLTFTMTPMEVKEKETSHGRIQVEPDSHVETKEVAYGLFDALVKGSAQTWDSSVMTLSMLGKIATGRASLRNISGPISIGNYAAQAAKFGIVSFLGLMALISISLGVMNLLPIPLLDGGHLLYYSLEVFTGKPISERFVEIAQRGGLVVLLCLMMLAFFNDIVYPLPH